jgi:hypothetical protein
MYECTCVPSGANARGADRQGGLPVIAKALNERGIKTATGKAWTAVQVIRVRERLADCQ